MDDLSLIYQRSLSSGNNVTIEVNKDVRELTLFWENFLNTTNDALRIEWLELFMFKYEILITDPGFNDENKHLLSSIPSQFICYLLKLVYSIISPLNTTHMPAMETLIPAATTTTTTTTSTSNRAKKLSNSTNSDDFSTEHETHSLASLSATATKSPESTGDHRIQLFDQLFGDMKLVNSTDSSDAELRTITALREFLSKGNGGRMLSVLESLDLKGLLCSKELASVLVSFFPRSVWSIENALDDVIQSDMADVIKLHGAIEEFEFHTKFYLTRNEKRSSIDTLKDSARKTNRLQGYFATKCNANNGRADSSNDIRQSNAEPKPDTYRSDAFSTYTQRIHSCDYVGSTILNILQKLIVNENAETLGQTSATVKSLWFSINQYHSIEHNRPFQHANHEKLKRKLVTITFLCLNKIFPSGKRLEDLFDVHKLLTRLIDAISIDCANLEVLDRERAPTENANHDEDIGVPPSVDHQIKVDNLKALCYSLVLMTQNMLLNRSGEGNLFELLATALRTNISTITHCLCLLTRNDREQKSPYIHKILNILLKLIYILNNIEAQQDKSSQEKLKIRRKLSVIAPPMTNAYHKFYKSFKCVLESIVLHIAQEAKPELLRTIFNFFSKYSICGCNIHLAVVRRILDNALEQQMHKMCLHFVKQNVLRAVFAEHISCYNCDTSNFLFEFKENFVTLYKSWFSHLTDPNEVIVFFKHISKISKYLHVDVQSDILVDIVLPVFRREKQLRNERIERIESLQNQCDLKISDSCSSLDSMDNLYSYSDKIITCCLNIFLCYLKDITVIKAFFMEENIQHLADLFVIPQFAYLVSNLLKIGIDHSQFLGETVEERQLLCDKMESLQIHLFDNIIELLLLLFNDMAAISDTMQLKRIERKSRKGDDRHDDSKLFNEILNKVQSKQLSIFEAIHLSVIYWNLILQIIRSSHDEFRAKVIECIASNNNIVVSLMYNSLSCVLFMTESNDIDEPAPSERTINHQSVDLNVTSESLISNLTLSSFENVSYNEFGEDLWTKCLPHQDCDSSDANNVNSQCNCFVCTISPHDLLHSDSDCIENRRRNGIFDLAQFSDCSNDIRITSVDHTTASNIESATTHSYNAYKMAINRNMSGSMEKSVIYNLNSNGHSESRTSLSSMIELFKSGNSAAPNYNHIHQMIDSVQKLTHFVSKKVFSLMSAAEIDFDPQRHLKYEHDQQPHQQHQPTDNTNRKFDIFDQSQLNELNTVECKRLLIHLFEITLGIMLCEYKDRKADHEMSMALQELKLLLLSKTVKALGTVEQTRPIMNALQSLLKVAEMRNKCCFFDDCAHPALALQNKFSLNISLENDRILLLTGRGKSNGTSANELYGHSDGDTTDTDNSYATADEGYDADEEAAKLAETDIESDWSQCSSVSAPVFRTHFVHEGICKIVIEILIDISRRCLQHSEFCLNCLMQITMRLHSIRDLLGGPLYLIKGFASILETNDLRLRDLQKSILDLITDLNTPDTLSAYLNLMTSESPPLDILLSKLIALGSQGQCVQPSIEIEFPVTSDGEIKHNCDRSTFETIFKIYNYQRTQKAKTAFTQAAYILPLNELSFKPWTKDGFTITSWLRLNSDQGSPNRMRNQVDSADHVDASATAENENNKNLDANGICSHHCHCKNKQHFISIGTNRMIFSIYLCVSNVNTMYFQLSNPNTQPKGIPKSYSEHIRLSDTTMTNGTKNAKFVSAPDAGKKRRNVGKKEPQLQYENRINRRTRSKEKRRKDSNEDTSSTSNVLSATITTTKLALKNRLSYLNLFSPRHNDNNESHIFGYPIEIKGVKLHKNRWTLFSLTACSSDNEVQIQIFVDNVPAAQIYLPCSNQLTDSKKDKISVLCIGHKNVPTTSPPTQPKDCQQNGQPPDQPPDIITHSDLESQNFRYSLSNVLLFRKRALNKEMLAHLYALGPDCINFTQCQIGNIIPNLGVSVTNKIEITKSIADVLLTLREHLLLVYSAHKPDAAIGYSDIDDGQRVELIRFGMIPVPKYIPSIQTAIFLSGGLSSILYLFARVVELSNSDIVQSSALHFLLKVAHSNSALYTEFLRQNYFSLIGAVIRSDKCRKTIRLLSAVLETACTGSIIVKGPDGFDLSTNKNICIIYADLFVGMINHYSDWYTPDAENCDIIEMLFSAIQQLVSEKHTYQALNISRLGKAKLVPALFNFCKIHLTSSAQLQIFWSKKAAESMVNIIRIFAGAPPSPALLDDIVKVLLMLHSPSNSFVTHDRSKFYFLLSPTPQATNKRNGLLLPARKLSLSLKKSPKSSTDSILQRSTSLDQKINKATNHVLHRSNSGSKKNSSNETIIELYPATSESERSHKTNDLKKSHSAESSSSGLTVDKKTNMILNSNDKAKLERALSQLNTKRNKRLRKNRVKHKCRQRTLTDCEAERDLKSKRRRKRSVSDSGIDLALFREYDIIADEEVRRFSGIINVNDRDERFEPILFCPAEQSQGIIQMQNGLFELLRDFIMILPDTEIEQVLSHYVTLDIVSVLANNYSACVRASIIRLLAAMCERYTNGSKSIYYFHLGNQISLYEADFTLVQSCIQWITGSFQTVDQIIQSDLRVVQKHGLNPLIALIPQTIHDTALSITVFEFLCQLLNSIDHEAYVYLIENGLIASITKATPKIYAKWGMDNDKLIEKIDELLCSIARRAIAMAGCVNILWDLLNSITYLEQNRNGACYRGIRSTQATILLHLIKSFFPRQNNPSHWNFKLNTCDISLNESMLSASEKRTRLELLLDRAVQFIRTANTSHAQTGEEIKLIEAIVILSMSGFSRGSSIIPWSFLPNNPMPLKLFVIKLIWKNTKNSEPPLSGCDPKIIKAMIHSFWLNDREIIPKTDVDMLQNVCKALGIQQNTNNSYIPQAILKMDLARENSLKEQKPSVERTVFRFDTIATNCIESAMKITRYVVEIQNTERRNAIAYIRVHDENCLKYEWNSIIERMTHEGAPWHSPRTTKTFWELDPTEGPTRVRTRMKRCNFDIPSRFFLKEATENRRSNGYEAPLSYLKKTLHQRPSCTFYDHVLLTFPCKHLMVDMEYEGELIITETHIIFAPNDESNDLKLNINVNTISEVWLRRYQHLENAIEFFLETNTSIFLILQTSSDRDRLKFYFSDKILQCPETKLNIITQQWREGQITNWEYLMALNLISGRTYQDLMQYPVFPWILADYESATLDLGGIENYRILSKPIAIQHASNENHYINSYNYLNTLYTATTDSHQLSPYHYGSHYSNSGTVLHFLVRIPPYTRYFLNYQDNNFDLPDRTFHSIVTTWRLASRDSTTDVKELTPEFFMFPEIFENAERFNFGVRQSGEAVDNVELPPWARESARLFIFIHRQALESDITRRNLHKWIDLVFGWRQSGPPAIEAINVFHPATYYGFSSAKISDPVERSAMETMVRTYGQMPKMLFKSAHPIAQPLPGPAASDKPVLKHVKGLRWGCYTGSPELGPPRACSIYQQFDVTLSHLMALPNTNVIYAFSSGHNVMQGNDADTMNIIRWRQTDGVVRIKPLRDGESFEQKPLTYNHHIDEITVCGTDPNFNQLWFGHESGRITVYQCNNSTSQSKYNKINFPTTIDRLSHNSKMKKLSMKFSDFTNETECDSINNCQANALRWKDPVILVRHTNSVTGIHISKEFKIVVSVANDGYAIIWDANNLNIVRSIQRPSICKSPISLVTVSPTLGDIVTVHDLFRDGYEDDRYSECCEATENIDDFVNVTVDMNGKSLLRVHTINAKYVTHITIPERILSVCYSYVKEGTGVNVIATGSENGIIRLWSSYDLSMVRELVVSTFDVLSLTFSTHQHLVILTSDNIVQVWDSAGLHGNPPKFPQVVFQKRNSV